MSAFAGIYYRNSKQQVEENIITQLCKTVSRSQENSISEFSWPGVYIVHADIGAFGHKCCTRLSDGGALVTAGQLLIDPSPDRDRFNEIVQFANSPSTHDGIKSLSGARGTFCLVRYSSVDHSILLAVDRLGVRPLYYFDDGNRVIFSTALRIIEGLTDSVQIGIDLQAIVELSILGFPLSNRTPFKEVHCFRGGEARVWTKEKKTEHTYWRWDEVPDRESGGADAAKNLHRIFMDAVRIRKGGDQLVRAFLSGGLDSRSIVTALKSLGVETHTYNISWKGSCDELIGTMYANHIGTIHRADNLTERQSGMAWPQIIAQILKENTSTSCNDMHDRPRLMWSGDGGSVGMGRVYMNESMTQCLRSGDIPGTVAQIMSYNNMTFCGGTLHASCREELNDLFFQSLCDELKRHNCSDPGKASFLFFLENDQRRHMSSFYENIDLNRVEYLMPFFDGDFLAASLALPFDETLYHRFYVKQWLHTFGDIIMEVPWQAYPGHEPCPLSLSETGKYQWSRKPTKLTIKEHWRQVVTALGWAVSQTLPTSMFSRRRLFAIGMAAAVTGVNYDYQFALLNKLNSVMKFSKSNNIYY